MIKTVVKMLEEMNERYSEFITVVDWCDGVEGLKFATFSLDDVDDEASYYYDRFNYSIKKIRFDDEFFGGEKEFVLELIEL